MTDELTDAERHAAELIRSYGKPGDSLKLCWSKALATTYYSDVREWARVREAGRVLGLGT